MEHTKDQYRDVRIIYAKTLEIMNIKQPDRYSCGITSVVAIFWGDGNAKSLEHAGKAINERDKLFIYESDIGVKYEDSLWLAVFVKEIFAGYDKSDFVKRLHSGNCDVTLYETNEQIENKYNGNMIRNGKVLDDTDLEKLYKKAKALGVKIEDHEFDTKRVYDEIDNGNYIILNTGNHWVVVYGYFTVVDSDGNKVKLPLVMDPENYFENPSLTNKKFRDWLKLEPVVGITEKGLYEPAIIVKVKDRIVKNLLVNPESME
jgi:hypothetical protein